MRLREAKERREQARPKLQQLKLFQDFEQQRIDLRKEEQKLKLMHEYELATVSENIWMTSGDAADPKPDDDVVSRESRRSSNPVDLNCESIPRTTNVPLPTVQDPIVKQSTSDFIGDKLLKKSGLNPFAPEWPCGLPTAFLANTNSTQGNAPNQAKH